MIIKDKNGETIDIFTFVSHIKKLSENKLNEYYKNIQNLSNKYLKESSWDFADITVVKRLIEEQLLLLKNPILQNKILRSEGYFSLNFEENIRLEIRRDIINLCNCLTKKEINNKNLFKLINLNNNAE